MIGDDTDMWTLITQTVNRVYTTSTCMGAAIVVVPTGTNAFITYADTAPTHTLTFGTTTSGNSGSYPVSIDATFTLGGSSFVVSKNFIVHYYAF